MNYYNYYYYLSVRSQRQMVPSSQTQIKILPSRENVVCRIGDVHFGWVNVTARINVGSGVLISHKNTLPHWLPNAINLQWWSRAKRINQISHSLYSKRCKIVALESPCLNSLELSFKRPGFQQIIEFSHDWKIKIDELIQMKLITSVSITYFWHHKIANPSYTVDWKGIDTRLKSHLNKQIIVLLIQFLP